MSATDTTAAEPTAAEPTAAEPTSADTTDEAPVEPDPVNDAVMAVLGGFASICGAPDDPDVAAAANAALRELDLLVAPR